MIAPRPPARTPVALLALLALLAIATASQAATTVTFDGVEMPQAAQGVTVAERWREFIPRGEDLAHWNRLASIREVPKLDDPKAYAASLLGALRKQNPDAPSALIENPKTGEVIADFITWAPDRAFHEFNVFRIGRAAGGGLVVQQYALRAYGDARDFLVRLKTERPRLVALMAGNGLVVRSP